MVERFDVRVPDLVGGDAPAEVTAFLVKVNLMLLPEEKGSTEPGQPAPDDAYFHVRFLVLFGKGG